MQHRACTHITGIETSACVQTQNTRFHTCIHRESLSPERKGMKSAAGPGVPKVGEAPGHTAERLVPFKVPAACTPLVPTWPHSSCSFAPGRRMTWWPSQALPLGPAHMRAQRPTALWRLGFGGRLRRTDTAGMLSMHSVPRTHSPAKSPREVDWENLGPVPRFS